MAVSRQGYVFQITAQNYVLSLSLSLLYTDIHTISLKTKQNRLVSTVAELKPLALSFSHPQTPLSAARTAGVNIQGVVNADEPRHLAN